MAREMISEKISNLTESVMEHQAQLASFAYGILKSRGMDGHKSDVEDVLSDAYLAAASKIRSKPDLEIENFYAWYRKFLFFACLKLAARKGQFPSVELEELENYAQLLEIVHSGQVHQDPDVSLFCEKLLMNLKEKDRDILTKSAQGYTSVEIAEELELKPEAVRQSKKRALELLRKLVKG